MASFNKVILLGNLTRDPEVRYTPKGTAVTELGMAVNRVYTAENGEKREETTFVDVTLWGRTAEIAGEYLKKGAPFSSKDVSNSTPGTTSNRAKSGASLRSSGKAFSSSAAVPAVAEVVVAEMTKAQARRVPAKSAPPPKAAPSAPDDDEIPF